MLNYIWPIALIVLSNTVYHICSKSVPDNVSPFAVLTVTYLIGAVVTLILYFVLGKGENLVQDLKQLNWAPYVLGIVIVGLEAGNIYAYSAGWDVSKQAIVQAAILSIILIFVGYLLFKEKITWNKVAGIAVVLVGLFLINMKK